MTTIPMLADVSPRLADFPPERICLDPIPGTATKNDVIEAEAKTGRLYELIDGILVEKTMGLQESRVASKIIRHLETHCEEHDLGPVFSPDGMMEIYPQQVRAADVSFCFWNKFPGGKMTDEAIPELVPDLAVEVISRSNRPGEMFAKLKDYFFAGVKLVWYVDPRKQTIEVYTSVQDVTTLSINDTLDGGTLLPGFSVPVATIFA